MREYFANDYVQIKTWHKTFFFLTPITTVCIFALLANSCMIQDGYFLRVHWYLLTIETSCNKIRVELNCGCTVVIPLVSSSAGGQVIQSRGYRRSTKCIPTCWTLFNGGYEDCFPTLCFLGYPLHGCSTYRILVWDWLYERIALNCISSYLYCFHWL